MAVVKCVADKVNGMRGKVPERYSLTVGQMFELREAFGHDVYELICASFEFGFYQGVKAERAGRVKK